MVLIKEISIALALLLLLLPFAAILVLLLVGDAIYAIYIRTYVIRR